jgi:ligand-binding sensor domain-containing protein
MVALLPLLFGFLQQTVLPQDLPLEPASTPLATTVERWGLSEGLPQAQVNAITSDSLGQIWIGTHGGLAVFDGLELHAYGGKLATLRITALCSDRRGVLWIGTEREGLGRFVKNDFESVGLTLPDGREPFDIMDIREASDGSFWVAHADGVMQLSESGDILQSLALGRSLATAEGADGTVWIAGEGLRRLRNGSIDLMYSESVDCVHVDRSGRVWAGDHHTRLLKLDTDGSLQRFVSPVDNGGIRAIAESEDGTIWIGGWNPLAFRDGQFFSTLAAEDLRTVPQLQSRALLIDREGSLWLGGGGLSVLRQRPLQAILHPEFHADTPRIAIEDRHYPDTVWIGQYAGALKRFSRSGEGVSHEARVQALASGADGYTYALSEADGLLRLHLDHFDTLVPPAALPAGPTLTLLQDEQLVWWGSCGNNLVQFSADGNVARTWSQGDGLDLGMIHKLALDPQGELWIGARDGVAVLDVSGTITRRLTSKRELAMGEVREIHFRDNGVTWLGHYGGGLSLIRPDGEIRLLSVDQGLHENVVHRILPEADGCLLLLGNRGISLLSAKDVVGLESDPQHHATPRVFDQLPGVPEFEGMGGAMPAGSRTASGEVFLPALLTAARFSPSAARSLLPAPMLKFVRLSTNRSDLLEGSAQSVHPEDRGLLVHYRAITFIDPHLVRYQYMLEGRDSDWVDAGDRELAHYESLPPGHYRFLVRAANRDGVWSEVLST